VLIINTTGQIWLVLDVFGSKDPQSNSHGYEASPLSPV